MHAKGDIIDSHESATFQPHGTLQETSRPRPLCKLPRRWNWNCNTTIVIHRLCNILEIQNPLWFSKHACHFIRISYSIQWFMLWLVNEDPVSSDLHYSSFIHQSPASIRWGVPASPASPIKNTQSKSCQKKKRQQGVDEGVRGVQRVAIVLVSFDERLQYRADGRVGWCLVAGHHFVKLDLWTAAKVKGLAIVVPVCSCWMKAAQWSLSSAISRHLWMIVTVTSHWVVKRCLYLAYRSDSRAYIPYTCIYILYIYIYLERERWMDR